MSGVPKSAQINKGEITDDDIEKLLEYTKLLMEAEQNGDFKSLMGKIKSKIAEKTHETPTRKP